MSSRLNLDSRSAAAARQSELLQRLFFGFTIENSTQTFVVELAHPSRNYHRREYVAEQISDRTDLRHETLHPEQQRQATDRQNSHCRQSRCERDKAGAGNSRSTLGGKQHHE